MTINEGGNRYWFLKTIACIVATILVVVVVCSILLRVFTNHGQEIVVPDFTNMSVEDAQSLASVTDIRVDVIDSVYIRRMGRGKIFTQSPLPHSRVKKGRLVRLTINSHTPKKVSMPDLVGCSTRQAQAELNSRGLSLGKLIYVSDIATNNVIRQLYHNAEIKAGRQINSDSVIDLVIGLNDNDFQTYIPNVLGLKYLRAVGVVHDNSLNINKLRFDASVKDYADSLDAVVYKQEPSASELPIMMGSEVALYLTTDPSKLK